MTVVGSGGDRVVSLHAFYPKIRVRIPLKSTIFILWIVWKYENQQKDAGGWPIQKSITFQMLYSFIVCKNYLKIQYLGIWIV